MISVFQKKRMRRAVFMTVVFVGLAGAPARAEIQHGGGLDGDGGHHCNVGSCAGTYHCHQARGPACGGGGGWSSGGSSYATVDVAYCVSLSGSSFTDSEVALIQQTLKSKGFRPGPVDGIYGSMSRGALNRFERKAKLKVSRGRSIYFRSIEKLGIAC